MNCPFNACPGCPQQFGTCSGCNLLRRGSKSGGGGGRTKSSAQLSQEAWPLGLTWDLTTHYCSIRAAEMAKPNRTGPANPSIAQVVAANPLRLSTPLAAWVSALTPAALIKRAELLGGTGQAAGNSPMSAEEFKALKLERDRCRANQSSLGHMLFLAYLEPGVHLARPIIYATVPNGPDWQKSTRFH